MKPRDFLIHCALIALHAVPVLGDGTGLLGYGKTMYYPTCAFACRNLIKGCRLSCTPIDGTENHGTAHAPVSTPPECFVKDLAFLRTMAICIDTYCPISTNPPLNVIEDYWASHLGTGSLADYSFVPTTSYLDALAAARTDERRLEDGNEGHRKVKARQQLEDNNIASSPLPIIEPKAPLNVTSFISLDDWRKEYYGMLDFETNEVGHSTYTIIVMLAALFLPVPLSLLRFVPSIAKSRQWTYFQAAVVDPPALGKRHRAAVAGGLVPTRGQALYIALISVLNVVLLLAPYVHHHPQNTFESLKAQKISIIGNRAGCMAMGNVVALFVFATRNNVLLYITDWSHSTYLLLHRWLGYWTIFHTVLHSVMLLAWYKIFGSYEAELIREYWIWGIVGTVAAVALLPASLLALRQKAYELFLASHVVLSVLFIVGYYYHIWYLYEYNWGYEIWAFIASGIWAVERLTRLARMTWKGYRTATVTSIKGTDGEYLRIDIEGVELNSGGVAYLCFPTLRWRFWENHPFSVAFSRDGYDDDVESDLEDAVHDGGIEKLHELDVQCTDSPTVSSTPVALPSETGAPTTTTTTATTKTTFFARVRTGLTSQLAARVSKLGSSTRLRVLIDGPYHHSGAVTQLAHCSSILYVAGGVGITAVLPYLRLNHTRSSQPSWLFWGCRKAGLVSAIAPHLAALPANIHVATFVGQRMDLDAILKSHLLAKTDDDGPLGIVVCGPPDMADDVRHKVIQLVRNGSTQRPYVLLDEAFGW